MRRLSRERQHAEAHVERFRLGARLTAHVRHRAKYRDVPLAAERAFVFTRKGRGWGKPARTLRAFVEGVARAPTDVLDGHARRSDFSRWIAEVFGDQPLAADLREVEERHRTGEALELRTALVEAISAALRGGHAWRRQSRLVCVVQLRLEPRPR